MTGFTGTPRCRICGAEVGANTVRYQMWQRSPQQYAGHKLWWLCAKHYRDIDDAITTLAETFFDPIVARQIKANARLKTA